MVAATSALLSGMPFAPPFFEPRCFADIIMESGMSKDEFHDTAAINLEHGTCPVGHAPWDQRLMPCMQLTLLVLVVEVLPPKSHDRRFVVWRETNAAKVR